MRVSFTDCELEQQRQQRQEIDEEIKQLEEKRASMKREMESLQAQKATAQQQTQPTTVRPSSITTALRHRALRKQALNLDILTKHAPQTIFLPAPTPSTQNAVQQCFGSLKELNLRDPHSINQLVASRLLLFTPQQPGTGLDQSQLRQIYDLLTR